MTALDAVFAIVADDEVGDEILDVEALERAWHWPDNAGAKGASKINSAQLTVTRNAA
mgnify:CR=1 FL=1